MILKVRWKFVGEIHESHYSSSELHARFCSPEIRMFLHIEVDKYFVATISEDSEPQHAPNNPFKHFIHHKCVKPVGLLLLENAELQNGPNDGPTIFA